MTDLTVLHNQPYPTVSPWIDLRSYLDESWDMGGSAWHFRGRIEGNTAHLHVRTRRGSAWRLTTALPAEFLPDGQLVLPAWEQRDGSIAFTLATSGALEVLSGYRHVADGESPNLIMQASYQRRPLA